MGEKMAGFTGDFGEGVMDREDRGAPIHCHADLLRMLDGMLREPAPFWERFYADRDRGVPFFTECPDENLVSYFERGILKPGRVLEFGCGNGRNAIYFAKQGCDVDAVDISASSIAWGKELARQHGVTVNFRCRSVYDLDVANET